MSIELSRSAFLKSSTLRGTLLFCAGAAAASAVILGSLFLFPEERTPSPQHVFSSAEECERTSGEACFLRECTPDICPAQFEKAWMPQSIAASISTATSTPEDVPTPGPDDEETVQNVTNVTNALSTTRACSSSVECSKGGTCIADEDGESKTCHRICKTNEECSLSHEEGVCGPEGWCSAPMILTP